jgi:hypothetical protein
MNDGAKCKELRPILQEIDKDFDVGFNFDTETYTVYHKGRFFQSVPYGQFTRETIANIRKTVININGDIFAEVDKANELAAKRHDRATELLAESLAKDIRKPLLRQIEGV